MSQKQGRQAASTHNKPSKSRQSKKGLTNSQSHPVPLSSNKSGPVPSQRSSTAVATRKEQVDEGDMPGLPEFCMTCETQIITPGSSILYCSEVCRKKDVSLNPMAIQTALSPSTNISSATSYFDGAGPDIVPPRSPTVVRPASEIFDFPASPPASPKAEIDVPNDFSQNEAARYLAQFYSSSAGERTRPRRNVMHRSSSATDGVPSLSHTPASSVGTVASVERPLPRKYGPWIGHASYKSIDLVLPSYPSQSAESKVLEDASVDSAKTVTELGLTGHDSEPYQRRHSGFDYNRRPSSGLHQLFRSGCTPVTAGSGNTGDSQRLDGDDAHRSAVTGL